MRMAARSVRVLLLIWIAAILVASNPIRCGREDSKPIDKESESIEIQLQDVAAVPLGSLPAPRESQCCGSEAEKTGGGTKPVNPAQVQVPGMDKCADKPSSSEAQAVWVAGKQALVEQIGDQVKDDESAVIDETAAVASVQKCVQSAVASGLEARQQAKIIALLLQNSKDLIDHIDRVVNVSNEELVSTEQRLAMFRDKVEKLHENITKVKQELAVGECGGVKPRQRKETASPVWVRRLLARKSELPSPGLRSKRSAPGRNGERAVKHVVREPRRLVVLGQHFQDTMDVSEIDPLMSLRLARGQEADNKVGQLGVQLIQAQPQALAQVQAHALAQPQAQASFARVENPECAKFVKPSGELSPPPRIESGGCKPFKSAEAKVVWTAGKQALIDQLNEQLKDDEAAVADESESANSVRKCVQSAVAAGLEARQQAKIINLLEENSKEMIEHMDLVESVANEELASTEERLGMFSEKLQANCARIAKVKQDMTALQECMISASGSAKPMCRLRRLVDVDAAVVPAVEAPHNVEAAMSDEISQLRIDTRSSPEVAYREDGVGGAGSRRDERAAL